ncbi:MAG: hypothetical protein ACW99A_21760 [Candidatus Kariarchaeaceae archaeon]
MDAQYIYTCNHQGNKSQNILNEYSPLNPMTYIADIDRINFIESVSILDYLWYGTLIGSAAGLVGGYIYFTSRHEQYRGLFGGVKEFDHLSKDLGKGLLIGAGVGFISGLIIGLINQDDDITISPNSPGGLAELKEYVLYHK